MMKLIPATHIDFLKFRKIFFVISAIVFVVGIYVFATKGLNLGTDFTGGTMVQVKFERPVDMGEIRDALTKTGFDSSLQTHGENTYAIREKSKQDNVDGVRLRIEESLDTLNVPYVVQQTNFVGPAVGESMKERAMWAILISLVCIIIYVAFRFNNILWGASGVIALFHDLFVMALAFALTQREIDLVVVAAFLTVAGYSINDTIVIFDRMRENIRLNPRASLKDIINNSINETLSRTIITSLTVIGALLVLYFFGGEALNSFAFAMLVGCICGVYTTVALTTPLIYVWSKGKVENTGEKINRAVSSEKKAAPVHTAAAAPAVQTVSGPAKKKRRRR